MKSIGTKEFVLEGDNILLRKFKLTDAESMFKNYCNDDEVSRYLTWSPHRDIDVTNSLLKEWVDGYTDNIYRWAIEHNGEVIGGIDLLDVNLIEKKAKLGYVLSKEFWGKGIMTRIVHRIIKFAFEEVKFKELEAIHALENLASGKVMIKNGMNYIKNIKEECEDSKKDVKAVSFYSLKNPLYKKAI